MWTSGPTISRPTALAKGSSTLRRLSTNVSPTKGWKEALATNLNAGRQAKLSAAVNEGEVIARRQLPNGLGEIHLGASQPLSKAVPGNGGLRLWQYASDEAASKEAAGLGKGMEAKHSMFNTGFAGAKVVCAVTKAPNTWSAADKKVALDEVRKENANQQMHAECAHTFFLVMTRPHNGTCRWRACSRRWTALCTLAAT